MKRKQPQEKIMYMFTKFEMPRMMNAKIELEHRLVLCGPCGGVDPVDWFFAVARLVELGHTEQASHLIKQLTHEHTEAVDHLSVEAEVTMGEYHFFLQEEDPFIFELVSDARRLKIILHLLSSEAEHGSIREIVDAILEWFDYDFTADLVACS